MLYNAAGREARLLRPAVRPHPEGGPWPAVLQRRLARCLLHAAACLGKTRLPAADAAQPENRPVTKAPFRSQHMPHEKTEAHSLFLGEGQRYEEACWRPPVDIYRAAEGWLLKFDLAGVQQQDIEVSAAGRFLTVRGIRRDWSAVAGQSCYHMEILYNRFERTVELPCEVGQAALSAEYREGMLLVRVITREPAP
jgi:HSP20 family molecular chaperone IbpA